MGMSAEATERLAALPREHEATDRQLIVRVLEGESAFYAVLMRRHNQRIFRVVRGIVAQDDEAEDVVQQAYVTAFDKLAQFRGDAQFSTWLIRIAVNEAYGRIRKRKNRRLVSLVETEQNVDTEPEPTPEDEAYRREMTKILEDQIDALPEALRVAFVLRDVEELNTAETSRALDISEQAVRVRLHRARALLQERLSNTLAAAPDAFHFAGERCDRLVLGVCERLHIG